MGDESRKGPTKSELAILQVLWEVGPATVNQIQAELQKTRAIGYTTVLKLLQLMLEKDLVTRDEAARSHVYAPKEKQGATRKSLVADLAARAFGGSTAKLVMQALSEESLTDDDRAEIESILKQMREK